MSPALCAIVPAAGRGARLSGPLPKQLMALGGLPLVAWSVGSLVAAGVAEVVVGAAPEWLERTRAALAGLEGRAEIIVIEGGAERQDTVRLCLERVRPGAEVALVHDAARPFVSPGLIARTIDAARRAGAATAAIRPADLIALESAEGRGLESLPRDRLWRIQTPQAFAPGVLAEAHRRAAADGFRALDDAALVSRLGHRVLVVEGEELNFKVTTAADWAIAEAVVGAGLVRPVGVRHA